jgi:hypothetical protein
MRTLVRGLPILALATTLSCADMPTAPRGIVTVTGQITDRDGPAIEQTRLYFISLDPRDHPPEPWPIVLGSPRSAALDVSTVTDMNGRYRIQLQAGPYQVSVVPESGYPPAEIARFEAGPGHTELNYRYTGVRITGTLTAPAGVVLAQAEVGVYRRSGPFLHWSWAWSNLIGATYSLLVPAGSYELNAGAFGNVGVPSIRRNLTVASDTTVDIDLNGNLVTGVVRGQNGLPLERIRITAEAAPTTLPVYSFSLADGSYTIYLPDGVYRFVLRPWDASAGYIAPRDFPPVSITGPASLDFDLSGVEWSGTVRSAADSTVVVNRTVVADQLRSNDYAYEAWTRTDAGGKFRLIVGRNLYYTLSCGNQQVGTFVTGSDTTFDIYTDDSASPAASLLRTTPAPRAGPGAPASAAVDPTFRRRSSRTAE